jgi:hypothetical protein
MIHGEPSSKAERLSSSWQSSKRVLRVAIAEIAERVGSKTFFFFAVGPFVAWTLALIWLPQWLPKLVQSCGWNRPPDLGTLVIALATGLWCVVGLWAIATAVWAAVAFCCGRYRHAAGVWMAFAMLSVIYVHLPHFQVSVCFKALDEGPRNIEHLAGSSSVSASGAQHDDSTELRSSVGLARREGGR